MWDVNTCECLKTLACHKKWINGLIYKNDLVYSCSSDSLIKAWDFKRSNRYVKVFSGHKDAVVCLVSMPNSVMIASSSWDKTVKLWDTNLCACLKTLTCANHISCLAFDSESSAMLTSCMVFDRNLIRFLDVNKGLSLKNLKTNHQGTISTFVIN